MKAMLNFMRIMLKMPKFWQGWILVMFLTNMGGAFVYLGTVEAWAVLAGLMTGAFLQSSIFAAKGFVKLLGLGHVAWVPMVPWLWMRLDLAQPGSAFAWWLTAVIVLDGISLVIDLTDVIRYLAGNRTPKISL